MEESKQVSIDMLQGNINRMCVTKDMAELKEMKEWAIKRINNIFYKRIKDIKYYRIYGKDI